MRLRPTGWSSPCRRALSYWLVLFISARRSQARRATDTRAPGFPPNVRTRPCTEKGQHPLLFPLLFVRCDVCCCGAVAPRVTAALLGRFLPRLGPLATASGPFFYSGFHLRGPATPPRSHARTDDGSWIVHATILPVGTREARRASGLTAAPPIARSQRAAAIIPPPPGRAAAPGWEARQGAPPASQGRRPGGRKTAYARTAARPYRARG